MLGAEELVQIGARPARTGVPDGVVAVPSVEKEIQVPGGGVQGLDRFLAKGFHRLGLRDSQPDVQAVRVDDEGREWLAEGGEEPRPRLGMREGHFLGQAQGARDSRDNWDDYNGMANRPANGRADDTTSSRNNRR